MKTCGRCAHWVLAAAVVLSAAAAGCGEKCPAGYVSVDGVCRNAVGGYCQIPSDCPGEICILTTPGEGFCTVACDREEDCPDGYFCYSLLGGVCAPYGQQSCASDEECDACQFCLDGNCVKDPSCRPCNSDDECAGCELCDHGRCQAIASCNPCIEDADCPPCQRCQSYRCEPEAGCLRCVTDSDCPACQSCTNGECAEIPGCGEQECFNDHDCPARTACLYNYLLERNTCLPVDLDDGQDCSAGRDAVCRGGLCSPSADEHWFCTRPCSSDSDCQPPFVCRYDELCRMACLEPYSPPPGKSCRNNLDCASGETCTPQPVFSTGSWEGRCQQEQTCGLDDGSACTRDAECASGFCSPGGRCTSYCAGDLDCPRGFLCVRMFRSPGAGLPAAPLEGCAPADDVPLEPGWFCGPPEPACEGVCLQLDESSRRLCTRACVPGEGTCPDSFFCGSQQSSPSGHYCLPARQNFSCQADSDCVPPEACRAGTSAAQLECSVPPAGLAGAGEVCASGSECSSGLCLELGLCTSPCRSASDCPEGWRCDPDYVSIGGAEAGFVSLCRPHPGSLAPCWSGTDCQSSETCRVVVHPSSKGYRGTCDTVGTGAATGAPCSSDAGCKDGVCLASGICSLLCKQDTDCPAGFECRGASYVHRSGAEIRILACQDIAREMGQPCPGGDEECSDGLFCYHPAKDEPYCTRECTSQVDCEVVNAEMRCEQEQVLEKTICVRM